MYFERKKSISVQKTDEGFRATVEFIDEYHNFMLTVISDFELVILDAELEMRNKPYEKCLKISEMAGNIKGIAITKGFTKAVKEHFDGSSGCAHMVDMLQEAARGLYQGKLKLLYETEGKESLAETLKGTCISY